MYIYTFQNKFYIIYMPSQPAKSLPINIYFQKFNKQDIKKTRGNWKSTLIILLSKKPFEI